MTATKTASKLNDCRCVEFLGLSYRCGRTTRKVWAPGHDARAKGFLQQKHRDGELVVLSDGREVSAREAAEEFVPALVPFLFYKRGTQSARFADDMAALADSAKSVQIKVGRWVYNGLVAGETVTYVTKAGEAKSIPMAEAKLVTDEDVTEAQSA